MSILLGTVISNHVILSADTKVTNFHGKPHKKMAKIYSKALTMEKVIYGFGGMLEFLFPVKLEIDNTGGIKTLVEFVKFVSHSCKKFSDEKNNKFGALIIGGFIGQSPILYFLSGKNEYTPIKINEMGSIVVAPPIGVEKKNNWDSEYEKILSQLNKKFPNNIQKIFKGLQNWFADNDPLNTCNYEQLFVVMDQQFEVQSRIIS